LPLVALKNKAKPKERTFGGLVRRIHSLRRRGSYCLALPPRGRGGGERIEKGGGGRALGDLESRVEGKKSEKPKQIGPKNPVF